MNELILVVDNQGLLKTVVESAVSSFSVRTLSVEGIGAAKRRLVQETPILIVSMVSFIGDDAGGLVFCDELKQHSNLSAIPVILVADKLTDEVIRRASECGAKGIVTWPLPSEALKRRIKPLLPEALQTEHAAPVSENKTPVREAPAPAHSDHDVEDKLKAAQLLLARVLHNLKTSDLLQVVEPEDVPRVVFEMCRSVCGFKEADAARAHKAAKESSEGAGETDVDLNRAFGKLSNKR